MKNLIGKLAIGCAVIGLGVMASPAASALELRKFEFSVEGFNGGGTFNGSFSGTDINGDGVLVGSGNGGTVEGEV